MAIQLRQISGFSEATRRGRELLRLRHQEEDIKKLGTLRAGNSGILTEDGEFAGCCPHTAHLRGMGLEVEIPNDSTLIMFQLGIESETAVFRDLQASLPEGKILLRESEIPIRWQTSNGTWVSGRPDGVVCRRVGEATIPEYGIELKSIASFWTTREVLLEGQPKLAHLIQATHYAWKLGVPYKLSYKQYALQAFPEWAAKFVPAGMEWCVDYNDKGGAKNIRPFEITYDVDIDQKTGRAYYKRETDSKWIASIVTTGDIERYYEFISRIPETGKLGNMVNTIDVLGNKKSYSQCKSYCKVHQLFADKESDYSSWVAAVTEYVTQQNLDRSK